MNKPGQPRYVIYRGSIDGRESVSLVVGVKELLENPDQLLFGKGPVGTD